MRIRGRELELFAAALDFVGPIRRKIPSEKAKIVGFRKDFKINE